MDETDYLMQERQDVMDNEDHEKTRNRWSAVLLIFASLNRIVIGIFGSITGPTMQYMAVNTNSTVALVSFAVGGKGLGIVFGTILYSLVKGTIWTEKPVLTTGISLLVRSFVMFITPFLHSAALLTVLHSLDGITYGYSDCGIQSLYLQKWGDVGSRPVIQLHHFTFGIGAFLGPIIAQPFLEMASQQRNPYSGCPGHQIAVSHLYLNNKTTVSSGTEISNPAGYSFFVVGGCGFVIAVFLCILGCSGVEDRVIGHHESGEDPKAEPSFREIWMFLLLAAVFTFCCDGNEGLYSTYIYSVALCSGLKLDVVRASFLNTIFWAGLMIFRAVAVLISIYFKPTTIIVSDLVGITIAMVLISVWGEHSETITSISTAVFGAGLATLLPSVVSWSCEVENLTGKYIFVFLAGAELGVFALLPIGGALFQSNPFFVIYLVAGLCLANILVFTLMTVYRFKRKTARP